MIGWLVDLLPARLWRPANLHLRTGLHFCVGGHPVTDRRVRTIERHGRTIAYGRSPFHCEH